MEGGEQAGRKAQERAEEKQKGVGSTQKHRCWSTDFFSFRVQQRFGSRMEALNRSRTRITSPLLSYSPA